MVYKTLCAHPEWPVRVLVTSGSPLGIRNLIFDRLVPSPVVSESGKPSGNWPDSAEAWANIANTGDVMILVKDLRPLFGGKVAWYLVHNGSHANDVRACLTAAQTGSAIVRAVEHLDQQ